MALEMWCVKTAGGRKLGYTISDTRDEAIGALVDMEPRDYMEPRTAVEDRLFIDEKHTIVRVTVEEVEP